jgi:Putative amidoligase enzyme
MAEFSFTGGELSYFEFDSVLNVVEPVCPVCKECGAAVTGEVCKGHCGEMICHDCFQISDLATCAACGASRKSEDLIKHPEGGEWCFDCINAECFKCDSCGKFAKNAVRNTVQLGANWHGRRLSDRHLCDRCAEAETYVCNDCGDRIHRNDAYLDIDDNNICYSCYHGNYVDCEECGGIIHVEDAYNRNDHYYCSGCHPYGENFAPDDFSDSGCIAEISSKRRYGIELETDECRGYESLKNTPWGAKNDCTVSGKELYSTILSGDDGLVAVRELGKLADDNNWRAGRHAGYHLHLDMRGELDNSKYAIAYAYHKTQEVWLSFVDCRRHLGGYCHTLQWACRDIDLAVEAGIRYYHFAKSGARYNWCNLSAIYDHGTIEIRLHEGTCDSVAVINWVKAHVRFADWAAATGLEGVRTMLDGLDNDKLFSFIVQEIWKDPEMSTYYGEKAAHHNHGYLSKSIGV